MEIISKLDHAQCPGRDVSISGTALRSPPSSGVSDESSDIFLGDRTGLSKEEGEVLSDFTERVIYPPG